MRRALALGLAAAMLLLSGCYDATDLGDRIFAINLALDTGEGAALRLTVQYPRITPVGQQPDEGGDALERNGYLIEQVDGESLTACMEVLTMVTPRQVSLMQLRGVYLSEALAGERELLEESLTALVGSYETRSAASVYLTRGRAEDVLMEKIPLFGARLSKSQAAQNGALLEQGVIPFAPLNRFYHSLLNPERSAVAVLAAVNVMQYIDTAPPAGVQATAYLAGELPRNTVDKVDLCGSAVLGERALVFLDGYETQLYDLLTGYLRRMEIAVEGETVRLEFPRPPAIRVELDGETPVVNVRLYVRCEEAQAGKYTERLQQDVLGLLLKLQQHGLDPVGIADRARMKALTIAQWQEMDWQALYPRARFCVEVR